MVSTRQNVKVRSRDLSIKPQGRWFREIRIDSPSNSITVPGFYPAPNCLIVNFRQEQLGYLSCQARHTLRRSLPLGQLNIQPDGSAWSDAHIAEAFTCRTKRRLGCWSRSPCVPISGCIALISLLSNEPPQRWQGETPAKLCRERLKVDGPTTRVLPAEKMQRGTLIYH